MACVPAESQSEWEFVRSLFDRPSHDDCEGPLLHLCLSTEQVCVFERIFDSERASDMLWAGLRAVSDDAVSFRLCAVHWLDLASLIYARSRQHDRSDWSMSAISLLAAVCMAAGWDAKEIVNMLTWQRTRLT